MATSNNNALLTALILWGNDNESGTVEDLYRLFSRPESNSFTLGADAYAVIKRNLHPELVRLIEHLGYDPDGEIDVFDEEYFEDVEDVLSMVRNLLHSDLSHLVNEYFGCNDEEEATVSPSTEMPPYDPDGTPPVDSRNDRPSPLGGNWPIDE